MYPCHCSPSIGHQVGFMFRTILGPHSFFQHLHSYEEGRMFYLFVFELGSLRHFHQLAPAMQAMGQGRMH